MRSYTVIYELIDDIRAAMEGELEPIQERVSLGEAQVRAVFGSGSRRVAGCMVAEGVLRRDAIAQVRDITGVAALLGERVGDGAGAGQGALQELHDAMQGVMKVWWLALGGPSAQGVQMYIMQLKSGFLVRSGYRCGGAGGSMAWTALSESLCAVWMYN